MQSKTLIHIMSTNFIMGTWLAKVTTRGGGLRWIGTMIFLIKPTTSPKTSTPPCLMEYDEDVCTTLFWFDPLGFFVT
jgi:hypothetical protein